MRLLIAISSRLADWYPKFLRIRQRRSRLNKQQRKGLWTQNEPPREDVSFKDINLLGQWCSCPQRGTRRVRSGRRHTLKTKKAWKIADFFSKRRLTIKNHLFGSRFCPSYGSTRLLNRPNDRAAVKDGTSSEDEIIVIEKRREVFYRFNTSPMSAVTTIESMLSTSDLRDLSATFHIKDSS